MAKEKKVAGNEPYNRVLARQAEKSVTDKKFEGRKGLCQKWLRQNVQALYGDKYDAYHKGSAELSRRAWEKSEYAVEPARGSVVGDILYKAGSKGNPHGHVGIRVAGNRVAENSSTTKGRVQGAKGYRALEEFGKVDLIVRLPEP